MRKKIIVLAVVTATMGLGVTMGMAPVSGAASGKATPVTLHNWKNTLRQNTTGWCSTPGDAPCDGTGYGTIDIVKSSFSNGGGYGASVAGPGGTTKYARVTGGGTLTTPNGCPTPGGENCTGPYTNWNQIPHPTVFPYKTATKNGYTTSVKIYIDAAWAGANPGQVVDWDTAVSDNNGGFYRDFVFNMCSSATGGGGFYISASNNAGGCSTGPTEITTSGWYTFNEHFTSVAGTLIAGFTVLDSSNATVLNVVQNTGTSISAVGGPRYGWLPDEDVLGLPVSQVSVHL